MSKITKFFDVYGMKCHSCEKAVEYEINKLQGIKSVTADYKNSMVIITYENTICRDEYIKKAIENSGFSNSSNMFIKVLALSILIISMFFLGNNPFLGSNISFTSNETYFIILFLFGILTSFHCIDVSGNINYNKSLLKTILLYNSGRIISYTLIGGVIGSLSSVFSFNEIIQNLIKIITGIFIIFSGLHMLGIKFFSNIKNPTIFKISTCVNNHQNAFIVGYLSGFSACGPLQTMQFYALSSGSFIIGASSMFVFVLGTLPLMVTYPYISSNFQYIFNNKIYKYVGVLIVVLGILIIKTVLNFI